MPRKTIDLARFTTEEALMMLLENVETDQKAAKKSKSHTAVTTSNRLIFDITKKIGELRAAAPDAGVMMTPYTSMGDDELGESLDVFVAHCPEHLVTRLQSSIDRRRMGPALALVADEDPGE